MALGLIGKKIGMTRVFAKDGAVVPVTVLDVTGNRVMRVKEQAKDGYRAVQLTAGEKRADRMTKSSVGQFTKAGVAPGRVLHEFRLKDGEGADLKPGSEIKADVFAIGSFVDVQGTSIGKSVRVSRALSSVTISAAVAPRTVTRCRTGHRALSASARRRAACSRARRWPAIWVITPRRNRIWKSCRSTSRKVCCS
jgi:hypothetical protein